MEPKEKAKELRDNYIFTSLDSNDDYETLKLKILIHAKRCALIAVDEIIKSGPSYPYDIQFDSMPHFRSLKYWQEVKQEIERL